MRDIISVVLCYNYQLGVSESMQGRLDAIGAKTARLSSGALVDWLLRKHRFKHERPLVIPDADPLRQYMTQLVSALPELQEVFQYDGATLDFRDSVTAAERQEIRDYVWANRRSDIIP